MNGDSCARLRRAHSGHTIMEVSIARDAGQALCVTYRPATSRPHESVGTALRL